MGPTDTTETAQLITSQTVHQGRTIRVEVDRVLLPNGRECTLDMVRHPGAAAIVPLFDNGDTLLVRQYRYAASGWLLEVPAGKLDHGEAPDVCAAREIEEETGHQAGKLWPLGFIFPTPGFADERIWLFAATGLRVTQQRLEPDEVLTVERMPLRAAVSLALSGEMPDAKSVCAILRAHHALPGLK